MSRPSSRRDPLPVWQLAACLSLLLLAALLFNNARYLFRTDLYEFQDLAADSLQILKAKHFQEIYGQYSRWGFHHPGPAFFYVQGWGEWLFHDLFHLVPRPLNAQMLATLVLNCLFAGTALATAARHVGTRTIFLPLALTLGIFHVAAISFYGAEFSALFLLGNWPAYFLVVPFAAMLLVFASVAAGRGESLPLAVLIGCFLAHGHIAQGVLFVIPLFLLSYAGLLLAGRREEASATPRGPFLLRPWQSFRREHWLSLLILAVFLLPIFLDFTRGKESNLARILAFRHEHASEGHKPFMRSLMYFLQYGGYRWFKPMTNEYGEYDAHTSWHYLKETRVVWEFWVVALLGVVLVMVSWARRASASEIATADTDLARERSLRRGYTASLALLTGVAVALSLVWGCIMNGEMYYLNSYFNFGLFYVGMVVVAAVAADALCAVAPPGWNVRGLWAYLGAAAAVFAVFNAGCFRLSTYTIDPNLRLVSENIAAALRADPPTAPRTRSLFFYNQDSSLAVIIALQLERAGHPFLAAYEWGILLGEDRCPVDPIQPAQVADGTLPFVPWRIVPVADVPAGLPAKPLLGGYALLTESGVIDPAAGGEIRFGGPAANDAAFAAFGWAQPEPGAAAYRLNDARGSLLTFHARPVPEGSTVRVLFDIAPFLIPVKKPSQRIAVLLGGKDLGTWQRDADQPLEISIPAALWNGREDNWFLLRFPDAATPASMGFNTDTRTVAFAFRRIAFRVDPAPIPPVQEAPAPEPPPASPVP